MPKMLVAVLFLGVFLVACDGGDSSSDGLDSGGSGGEGGTGGLGGTGGDGGSGGQGGSGGPGPIDPGDLEVLPVIRIDTENQQPIVSKEDYITATVQITTEGHPEYDLTAETDIRGRGNSTWNKPKKPYRLKFKEKQSLFGYEKAKSWVLLAEYRDPTLLMNAIAFQLGRRLGLPYTNHSVHVVLYLNGAYQGIYTLTEQVQVGEGRVNVDADEGFLVELDSYYDEDPKFRTPHYDVPVMIKSPENLADDSAYEFVRAAINELEAKLAASDFPENGYRDLIDLDTFVTYFLVTEMVANGELRHPKSTYMYRDKDGLIGMGPLWDYDWAFSYSEDSTSYFTRTEYRVSDTMHAFFKRFFADPVFSAALAARWNEKYPQIASIPEYIDRMATKLGPHVVENHEQWPDLGPVDYAAEIDAMKTWYTARAAYLNTALQYP